jgi:pilus assembly protein CpaE
VLTAGVVGEDRAGFESLRSSLVQTGLVGHVFRCPMSSDPKVNLSGYLPDVILLDISRIHEPHFTFAEQMRHMKPTIHLIGCSSSPNHQSEFVLRAMRSGIRDILAKPVDSNELRDLLSPLVLQQSRAKSRKVIAVMGAKGGVGTSTVALNLSVELAEKARKKVALFDLARPLGHIALMLDLQPQFSLRDAAEELDRLDAHLLGGWLCHHESGVDVLAGPVKPDHWQEIPTSVFFPLVKVAQSAFDFVVLDCGSLISSEWKSILSFAQGVMVTELNCLALCGMESHFSALATAGIDPADFRIVVNRWRCEDEEQVKQLEKRRPNPILARLPNDFRAVKAAITQGTPVLSNRRSLFARAFKQLTFGVLAHSTADASAA